MTTAKRNRLTADDRAILELESPKVAGHTCKVLTVEAPARGEPLSLDALRSIISSRIDREPRMKQKLSSTHLGLGHLSWIDDDEFDITKHVKRYELDEPADRHRLHEVVAQLMTTRLDRSHPLWGIHLVELTSRRHALVILLHHCMADGMTAVRMCSRVLWDVVPGLEAPATTHASHSRETPPPTHTSLRATVRRELSHRASETPLDRHPTDSRTVAVASAGLSDLKRIGRRAGDGATVNDVVLCVVAGGLRSWLEHHGGPLGGIRVKVPVSLHHHGEGDAVGNHDSFMIVDVGTDEPDPVARLRAIRTQTRERKLDRDAQSLDRVFADMRRVSGVASDVLARWSRSPRVFTVNVSNVPGPRQPIAVIGGLVSEMFTLAEIGDRHALRVSVISLVDEVEFGICADEAAVADPEVIAEAIEADIGALNAL